MRFHSTLALVIMSLALFGQGCFQEPPPSVPAPAPPKTGTQTEGATYEDLTKEKYEAAKAAGKPLFLNFYANWCPTCREQEPRINTLFQTGRVPDGIVGFRIHFNDNDVTQGEKELAKEFGITYQHTYIFIDSGGREITRTFGTTSDQTFLNNLMSIVP